MKTRGRKPWLLRGSVVLSPRYITRVALIAAVYATVTVALAPVSYGPIQIRVSEALAVLPFVSPAAVPGLFFGCLLANMLGGFGLPDIVLGSAATLVSAALTRRVPHALLAPLPPVIVNAVVVSAYLSVLAGLPYLVTMGYIAFGQFMACYVLGYPLLTLIIRSDRLRGYLCDPKRGNPEGGG